MIDDATDTGTTPETERAPMLTLGLLIAIFIVIPVASIVAGADTWQDNGWSR